MFAVDSECYPVRREETIGRDSVNRTLEKWMRRFRELIAGIREKYTSDDFFAEFESWCRVAEKRRHYRAYNDALMLLDDDSWNILKDKAVEHFLVEREGQRKQGFFNQLNEAFAYRYLYRRGFEKIRFIKETKGKTPDIGFSDRGKASYCEVKTIGISDAEINRRETGGVYDGIVYLDLSDGFLNKLVVDIDHAWTQIRSLGEAGLVFILIRPDDIAQDHAKRHRKQLVEFCRSRGFENVVIKIDPRGSKGIRIKHRLAVDA